MVLILPAFLAACGEGVFTRDVGNINGVPVANAGPDQIVLVGQEVLMDGKNSADPDGEPLQSYRWALTEQPYFSVAFLLDWNVRVAHFVPDIPGRYYLELTVSDGRDKSTDRAVVRAREHNPENRDPVIDFFLPAEEVIAVLPGGEVMFQVSGSDPDGDEVAINWYRDGSFVISGGQFAFIAGADEGGEAVAVRVEVSDGEKVSTRDWVVVISRPSAGDNRPPVLEPISPPGVREGEILYFLIRASDPDADPVKYYSSALPEGAVFSGSTGAFSWTPDYDQAGEYRVIFTASDGELLVSSSVDITVVNTNRPPSLEISGDSSVAEGGELVLLLTGADPDGDGLVFTWSPELEGTDIYASGTTAAFVWRPGYEQAGDYSLTFAVTDESDPPYQCQKVFAVAVADTNRPPALPLLPDWEVSENGVLAFVITATDPDGDGVSYEAESLPEGAALDAVTGEFAWQPGYDQAAIYLVSVTAFDSGAPPLADEGSFLITVINTNRAPVITSLTATPGRVQSEEEVGFTVSAADPDGDDLQYEWDFDGDGEWDLVGSSPSETYAYERLGNYAARVRASDIGGLSDEETAPVSVRVGVAERVHSRSVMEGQAMGLFIEAPAGSFPAGYLYVAGGKAGMQIFLVPNLADPELVLWSRIPSAGEARNVTVSSGRAYLSLSAYHTIKNGTAIIDVADRGAPEFVEYLEATEAIVDTVVSDHPLTGDAYIYLLKADAYYAMFIYELEDLVSRFFSVYTDPWNYGGRKVTVDGRGYVYAAADRGLGILDFQNPGTGSGGFDKEMMESDSRDVKINAYPGVGTSCALLARAVDQGGLLRRGELVAYDVNDPVNPVELDRILMYSCHPACGAKTAAPEAMTVGVGPQIAYLALSDYGYQMADVRKPWGIQVVNTQSSNDIYDPCSGCDDYAYGIAAYGDHVYLADGPWGVQVVKNTFWGGYPARATTSLVASAHTSGEPADLKVQGDRLAVALGRGGMDVYDLADPGMPALVGNVDTPGEAKGVWIDGDGWAYVADRDSTAGTPPGNDEDGLRVVDVATQPTRPEITGSSVPAGLSQVSRVVVNGSFAYLCANALYLIDVTSKTSPLPRGTFGAAGPRDVAVSGNYAYVVYGASFVVLNVSDPDNPVEEDAVSLSDGRAVAYAGGTAYVADAGVGLRIFDVSDPQNISVRGSYGATAYDVDVLGDYAFVAADAAGVLVVDVSDPDAPELLAQEVFTKVVNRVSVGYDDGAGKYYAYTLNGTWELGTITLDEMAVVEVR